jgi:tetratricopeptide (TPR) repeat protein
MNAVPALRAVADPATTVDDSSPWLGLASFTEETSAYFYGREEEVAELARRVQRKLLTLLFGQSGLGKTSILRAGLVPRLRRQGYCPIYVRIDYARGTPEPAEQIKQAIQRTARRAGQWSQVGVAVEGESLWEFLHHRDDVLFDESGNRLIPLLIFDQFEEIFTLAQSDEFGRARAARFVAELGDLVENRPPKEFEAKLEEDESAAERFDFARSDYRVLIALREDYLAPLESLKRQIPSISQNRLRLAPMTGTQALAAVLQPGKRLVTEEVAEAIVRFVAGGAELANAEVEPSLLSLICRELNDARIAQGRSEISLDLLAGSHATILSNFYERALADQPLAVRRVIEDDLLTSSGFRENVAEERILKRLAEAGAAPDALSVLVNRRLLRIEERLDIRRVELTHDVLCAVVKASRDQRQEREAREATERLLAEQRARELAAHRTAIRARQVAGACTLLAVAAIGAALFGYLSSQRAKRAEHEAQQTQLAADQARGQAEQLLGYLSADFARDLESFGRLDVLTEFSTRQIAYFEALPPALRGNDTVRNAALAMIYRARARRALGQLDSAIGDAREAEKLLTGLQQGGDHSESTVIALAFAYLVQSQILDNRNDPQGRVASQQAAQLLRPLAESGQGSAAARRAFVEVLSRIGYEQTRMSKREEAVGTELEAMRIATGLGALDPVNVDMGARYAEACAWLIEAYEGLGRAAEARKQGEQCVAVADKVLERRPGYRLALHAQQVTFGTLAQLGTDGLDPQEAWRWAQRQEQVSIGLLNLDPNNVVSLNNIGVAEFQLANISWSQGKLREALVYFGRQGAYLERAAPGGAAFLIDRFSIMWGVSWRFAMIGDDAAGSATLAAGQRSLAQLRHGESATPGVLALVNVEFTGTEAILALGRSDYPNARRLAGQAIEALQNVPPGSASDLQLQFIRTILYEPLGRADFELGDYAAAEQALKESLEARRGTTGEAIDDQRWFADVTLWVAMAQARLGHTADASRTLAPVLTLNRAIAARNRGDAWVPVELARSLYVQSLIEPEHRAPLLAEAGHLLAGLAPQVQASREVRQWSERIRSARGASAR